MKDFTIREHLFSSLKRQDPSKTVLRFPGMSVSAGQLKEDTECLGTALYAHGMRGKRIAAYAKSEYGFVLLLTAVCCGKMTLVPLYEKWTRNEKEDILRRTEAAVFYETFENISDLVKEGRNRILKGDTRYLEDTVSPEDASMILFTSGTTGKAKGVPFLQRAWQPYVRQIASIGWNEETLGPQLLLLPLFHLFCSALLIAFLCNGIPVVFGAGLKHAVEEVQKLKPKALFLVPAQVSLFYYLIREDRARPEAERKYGNLERIIYSGAGLSTEMVKGFREFGIMINSAYSMTECSGIAFDPYALTQIKPGSSGRLLPEAKDLVRIGDPDPEGYGELLISEDYTGVFKGYLDDPEETEKILYDGWLHTGDLARIDQDGDLFITGRIKNLIILSNGENVSPEKLEQLVMRLEGVRECMVYEEDNRLTVKIVPGDMGEGFFEGGTEKYFREKVYQMNRELPPYEQIGRIRICDHLEKNAAGKKIRINHGISADHL